MWPFFLISSMVLGLPHQVQFFSLWYLIELLGILTGLGLLELWYLIYPRLLTGFGMLVYFTNLGLGEFPVICLALFCLFSVVDGFLWFWMESLHRSFLLVLKFLKDHSWSHTFPAVWYGIYADDTTLYFGCDLASDLWQQLELAAGFGWPV